MNFLNKKNGIINFTSYSCFYMKIQKKNYKKMSMILKFSPNNFFNSNDLANLVLMVMIQA